MDKIALVAIDLQHDIQKFITDEKVDNMVANINRLTLSQQFDSYLMIKNVNKSEDAVGYVAGTSGCDVLKNVDMERFGKNVFSRSVGDSLDKFVQDGTDKLIMDRLKELQITQINLIGHIQTSDQLNIVSQVKKAGYKIVIISDCIEFSDDIDMELLIEKKDEFDVIGSYWKIPSLGAVTHANAWQ